MTDDELLEGLETCELPENQFHHIEHLQAAWIYLTRFPALEAIAKASQTIRRYSAFLGKPERYHETITWAYLLLLNERIRRYPQLATWAEFAAVHQDLMNSDHSLLLRYYTDETLRSEFARQAFVMPDRLLSPR